MLKKKMWANFQRIIELFTQKIVNKLSKIWVWDPGSEIRDPEKTYSGSRIPDPGVKKAPEPGSGSATLKSTKRTNNWRSKGANSHHFREPAPDPLQREKTDPNCCIQVKSQILMRIHNIALF
jgi:hypothetical protein